MTEERQSEERQTEEQRDGEQRSIELEVEVAGTPEEVWEAIATGPGISSWYVPHRVEEQEGGAAVASFGPDMDAHGRVAAWDPPRRFAIDSGIPGEGLAFEWLIEARDGGTCIVRLVNSGFGSGDEWDSQYDAMTDGWRIFLFHLRLHLQHFAGQFATAMLPMAMWPENPVEAWARLTSLLGVPESPQIGDRIVASTDDATVAISGTVAGTGPTRISLLLDGPAPGTAFIASEAAGDLSSVSVWAYLHGPDAAEIAGRTGQAWHTWLSTNATS